MRFLQHKEKAIEVAEPQPSLERELSAVRQRCKETNILGGQFAGAKWRVILGRRRFDADGTIETLPGTVARLNRNSDLVYSLWPNFEELEKYEEAMKVQDAMVSKIRTKLAESEKTNPKDLRTEQGEISKSTEWRNIQNMCWFAMEFSLKELDLIHRVILRKKDDFLSNLGILPTRPIVVDFWSEDGRIIRDYIRPLVELDFRR